MPRTTAAGPRTSWAIIDAISARPPSTSSARSDARRIRVASERSSARSPANASSGTTGTSSTAQRASQLPAPALRTAASWIGVATRRATPIQACDRSPSPSPSRSSRTAASPRSAVATTPNTQPMIRGRVRTSP